jgi:hypothetical protein
MGNREGEYSETGFSRSKPIVIADADAIGILEEFLGFLLNELIQTFRAIFFHALEAHKKIHRELDVCFLMCLNDIQPSQHRPFIVRRSPTVQSIGFGIMNEHKGFRRPSVVLQGRSTKSTRFLEYGYVHIIMSVDENGLLFGIGTISSQDDRRKFQFDALHIMLSQWSLFYSIL